MPHKDIDKRRESARKSARKHKDKRHAYYQEYMSDPVNRAKKKAYMDEYESSEEVREAKQERSRLSYLKNKDTILARQACRRRERLDFMNVVSLRLYGEKAPTFVESLVTKRVSEANETVTKPL